MIAISVAVDRAAALLRGHDLGDRVTVEVSPETIGADLWPTLVGMLETVSKPPRLFGDVQIGEATAEAVRGALAALTAKRIEMHDKALNNLRAVVATRREVVAASPVPREMQAGNEPGVALNARYQGFARDLPYIRTYLGDLSSGMTAGQKAEWSALATEAHALETASTSEIKALNAAALAAVLPALREAHAREMAELNAATEAAEAAKATRIAERAAARLASGYWERETSSYNDRRYGAPWCAKVTGIKARGELVYEWGDSTARHGDPGLLRVACKPGEIVAWGQKDLRKPAGSDHRILRMLDDGRMETIDRTEAYRRLTVAA